MRSTLPKVLHPVAGRPMLAHVLATAHALNPAAIHIVYGHAGAEVRAGIEGRAEVTNEVTTEVTWVHQAEQLGTGHAVAQALPLIPDTHTILILCGDVPLVTPATLTRLIEAAGPRGALLSVHLDDPHGYGRVLRLERDDIREDDIQDTHSYVAGIVEERDATEAQRAIQEVNSGVMCLPAAALKRWLSQLDTNNTQGEYYLTDCVAMSQEEGQPLKAVGVQDSLEVQGINDRAQLARVERAYQQRLATALMREHGLSLADPHRFDVRGSLSIGRDCAIDIDVIIEGHVTLGDNVRIGPFCRIRDTHISSGSEVHGHCDIQDTHIGKDCNVGPFARLRPGTHLDAKARVGNFVETKKTFVGEGSKINHLSYIGDATLGVGVNVGAGTITCNYDGKSKHDTHIGNYVFIGSNSALVAPIVIGDGATVGAGTTLRNDVAADTLAVGNKDTHIVHGWHRQPKDSEAD